MIWFVGKKNVGKRWKVTAQVWKAGKKISEVYRLVDAESEEELEAVEKQLRNELANEIIEKYTRKDLGGFRIEVDSEIE